MTETRFDGQVAVITGGAGGLGRALAAHLVKDGARVALVDKDEQQLARVSAELGPVLAIPADVSVEADVVGYVQRTLAEYGRVDLFFNNAGIEGRMGKIVDTDMAEFDRVIGVNL